MLRLEALLSLLIIFLSFFTSFSAAINSNSTRLSNSTSSDTQALIEQALQVLTVVNKDRIKNPVFNSDKREDPAEIPKAAPLLDYTANPETISAPLQRRDSNSSTGSGSYRIPQELAEAAADVAKSTPQKPFSDQEEVAARIHKKYTPGFLNDTNNPEEFKAPEGRLSVYAGHTQTKRASTYWIIDDQTHPGVSPFSPAGYKVWRNVKDFRARGDGKTDDTAAINKAISDGARCGETCKISTIAPAVVYFPPGTYLVSGSIIQYYNTQFLGDVSAFMGELFCFCFTHGHIY